MVMARLIKRATSSIAGTEKALESLPAEQQASTYYKDSVDDLFVERQ
jgi:hypothetical protein